MIKSSENIKDIVFDLGNVLVPFDWNRAIDRVHPFLPPRYAKMISDDGKSFRRIFLQHASSLETGRMDFQTFWELTTQEIGLTMGLEEFQDIWCDIFEIHESVVSLAERLTENYGLWLASNTCKEHFEWIRDRFPRIGFFHGAALSYELGVMKPSRGYFERAIELFRIDPFRTVFIDDLSENVEGARRVGMSGIIFTGYENLIDEFKALGILTE